MTTRLIAATLVVLASTWPLLAGAVEFGQQAGPPPLEQTPSGFVGVPGPHAWSPEHFQAFPTPPPAQPQAQACTSCPAPSAQTQLQPAPNTPLPAR